MAITWSIAEGRVLKAEKGNECQPASVWLPRGLLIQEAGAEWAAWGRAKLSQGGVHEKEAGFIHFLIKNRVSQQNHCFWRSPCPSAWELASQTLAGLLQGEGLGEGPSLVKWEVAGREIAVVGGTEAAGPWAQSQRGGPGSSMFSPAQDGRQAATGQRSKVALLKQTQLSWVWETSVKVQPRMRQTSRLSGFLTAHRATSWRGQQRTAPPAHGAATQGPSQHRQSGVRNVVVCLLVYHLSPPQD